VKGDCIAQKCPEIGCKEIQHGHHHLTQHMNVETNSWQPAYNAHKMGAAKIEKNIIFKCFGIFWLFGLFWKFLDFMEIYGNLWIFFRYFKKFLDFF
jgi:hypothetical protein